ncbi:hypothetical protein OAO15_00585 [bacterium]|jgi:hypothetical protein|nr:hypothetical protein [bacterium]
MEIYSLDNLSLREVRALRTALDSIPITGIDAGFIALLQHKLSSQTQSIENHIKKEEEKKQESFKEVVKSPSKQVRGKKNN